MAPDFTELTETLETLADSCERLLDFIATQRADDPAFAQEIAILRLVASSSRRAALFSRQMIDQHRSH